MVYGWWRGNGFLQGTLVSMGGLMGLGGAVAIVVSVLNLIVERSSDPAPGIVLVQGVLAVGSSAAWISFWAGMCRWLAIGSVDSPETGPGSADLRWNRWFRDESCSLSEVESISNAQWSLFLVVEIRGGPRLRIAIHESLADFLEVLLEKAPQARVDVLFPMRIEQRMRAAGDPRTVWKR